MLNALGLVVGLRVTTLYPGLGERRMSGVVQETHADGTFAVFYDVEGAWRSQDSDLWAQVG